MNDEGALESLKKAYEERYRIVVCGDDSYALDDHKEALEFIERARLNA